MIVLLCVGTVLIFVGINFLAQMIEKYGDEVLAEIEAEEEGAAGLGKQETDTAYKVLESDSS